METSAPKGDPFEIRNKKADDIRCDAKAQGDTELPENYESSSKEDSDSRSLNRKTDINWGIAGGKFPDVDIFDKLREKRTTRPTTTEESNDKAPIQCLNQSNPLKRARIIATNVQGNVARPPIMDSPAILPMIVLVWGFLEDHTLSPNTLCPERHLQTFLLVGHNYLDVRPRSGELYIFQADGVFVRSRSHPVFYPNRRSC